MRKDQNKKNIARKISKSLHINEFLLNFPFFYAPLLNILRKDYGFAMDFGKIELVDKIIKKYPVTSFVETGTYRGDTAHFMARKYPDLPIYTCEIDEKFWKIATRRLKNYRNAKAIIGDSVTSLKRHSLSFGDFPLFFLDAHAMFNWREPNPLMEELKAIKENFKNARVIVDDVETDNCPNINKIEEIKKYFKNCQLIKHSPPAESGYVLGII